ncbi:uncharacterized protein LOC103720924 isoform X1 [Phoenix dactylifera]|uniref:Uncharacterized protein LOC103720924 isoform X1 n=1 Tax=Phoenix dactylifera TaxID=42345 RepID=A0A8B8ZMH9_PHODC|nr:uncharacterized protein LOC103720924 isoform X1 [Phoenix dactylifera]
MFVRKLVEKASKKHIGGGINGIREEDVNPRLIFHYGVPAGASSMAYDPIQHILAISTRNGQIKLFGKDNTQALLQSQEAVPSKFLQFMENQGILLNVTVQNHIEVWDIDKKQLCNMHIFNEEITAFSVVQQSFFIYVGDCVGNISVLKLDHTLNHLVYMQYRIPFSKSHAEAAKETAVTCTLQQPMAESKRVLIIFRDGVMSLWGIQESKVVFTAGGNVQHKSLYEPKSVVSACWACAIGSKVVVGYDSGEIFLWAIPLISAEKATPVTNRKESYAAPSVPLFKLNLGYKMDKVPIVSLRWFAGDGRAGRLYVNGFSDHGSSHSFQVIILNDNCESRTIKLMLPLTEACLAMELISGFSDQNKHKENALVLLLKSGRLCLYNDSEIEHYLLKSQSKSSPTLPNQLMVKLPFGDSGITIARLYTCNPASSVPMSEDHIFFAKKYSRLLSIGVKEKDGSPRFSGFSKTKSLLITGHFDGAINIWDASCPLLLPILSIKKQQNFKQSEDGNSSGATPVTSLHFDVSSHILVSGDQNGLVCIIIFKKEQLASENIFSFLQAKQGDNYIVHTVKLKGAVTTIGVNPDSKHFAIGTDKGFVSIIDEEGTSVLYQKQIPSQHYSGIISLQFKKYCQDGSEKNVLFVGLRDSSVFPLEEDTGNALSINYIRTKKPSRALLMEILDASPDGMWISDGQHVSKESSFEETAPKQSLLLLCSENTVRLYSLSHAIQGIKKLCCKKKLSGTCCFASVLCGPSSDVGLILVFDSGKIEIRSLPDLTLLKEASILGSTNSLQKSNLNPNVLCSSSDGELVMVNGDQEIFFFTILYQDLYRNLEYINQVYEKDIVALQEGISSLTKTHKEKKKGVLGMIVKDLKGNKTKHRQEIVAEVPSASTSEELSAIFSTANFSPDIERRDSLTKDGEDVELDIEDIDLDDTKVKHKGRSFAVLNKQKLGKKFQALKGKLKPKRDEKVSSGNYNHEDESVSEIDQIKKKYGFSVSNEASVPKIAESKLRENVRKFQAISDRTSEMENNAQSFSSLANKVLQAAQRERSK